MTTQPRCPGLEVENLADVTLITFTDKKILDEQNIEVIGEQLFDLVDKQDRKKILLSFSNVDYFSSACLGNLLTLNKKVTEAGGRLVMCGMNRPTYEIFEIHSHLKFVMVKDEKAALDRLGFRPPNRLVPDHPAGLFFFLKY